MAWGRLPVLCSALLLGLNMVGVASAASDAEIDRMQRFALLLGRGIGCDLDTDQAVAQIDFWFEQTFPPVSADRRRTLSLFEQGVRFYAQQQRSGESPDDCTNVENAFEALGW